MKKTILIIIIILLSMSLVIFGPSWFSSKEQRLELSNKIDVIEIDIDNVNATIVTEKQDFVEAKLKGKGSLSLSQKRDTIEIEYNRPWFQFFNFFGNRELVITIPEDYDRDLELDVGSGKIEFSSSSKDMLLNNLSLDVGSGNIQLNSIKAREANLDVSSGNIDMKHFAGKLNIDLSSGNISIQMDELINDIEAEVSSGKIVLKLPDNSDFTLSGKVSSGNIFSKFPLENEERSKNGLKGTHGSGTHHIELDVSSGSIEIR